MQEWDNCKQILLKCIKEVAFRVYLIESRDQYSHESFNIDALISQFGLERKQVLRLTSALIVKGKVNAKICLETNNIVLVNDSKGKVGTLPINDRKEIEHLQENFLGKISQLVEANDRCMDLLINQNYYITHKSDKLEKSSQPKR